MNWDDTLKLREAGLVAGFHGHNTPMEDWDDEGTEGVPEPDDADELAEAPAPWAPPQQ